MTTEFMSEENPKVQRALAELQRLIAERWPSARFAISRGEDNPEGIHLNATVDVEDPEEVLDLVIDRVVELQTEQELPIHVIPLRPVEKVIAELHAQQAAKKHHAWGRSTPLTP
jgi:hypothetical protein